MFDKLKKKFKKKKIIGILLLIVTLLIIFPFEDLIFMSWIGYNNYLWLSAITLFIIYLNGGFKFSLDFSQLKSQIKPVKVFFAGLVAIISWIYILPFISNQLVTYHIIAQEIPLYGKLFFSGTISYTIGEMIKT